MGFFKNIFKRKEGGTVVGNILRAGSNLIPGVGALYNGINPVPGASRNTGVRGPDITPTGTVNGGNLPTATVRATRPDTVDKAPAKTFMFMGIALPSWAKYLGIAVASWLAWTYVVSPAMAPQKGRRRSNRRR